MSSRRPFLQFVTPSDVRALKVRRDADVRALDASVKACAKLDEPTRSSWRAFSDAWRVYFEEEDSWLHTAAQMNAGEDFEDQIAGWQKTIEARGCVLAGPKLEPPPSAAGELSNIVKPLAFAAVAVAGVVALKTVWSK